MSAERPAAKQVAVFSSVVVPTARLSGNIAADRAPLPRLAGRSIQTLARERGTAPTARLLLEPLHEPTQHAGPDLVFADLVLDAVLEVGVVVDLHHDKAAVGLLDVDAVEAVADRARGAHRDVDQGGRRLVEIEGA